ncbi:arginyl-tRNA synthetase [Parvularcula bermudensis HTCC2503]|uniref:Arginine--tRNA ligase n=1 Tax=Parvularcula bermudensis (strain ATCC BAA-594 / HTCC2503 / KCTC 12087) TaxID=314260 RepID=E0TC89_PARBH|nr:arginine--tRNA ligase [Parvularcula bermudensis]ADM08522.1 arginyl-tRNA synthetase [Parvularcula bermudensis HTCC2503]
MVAAHQLRQRLGALVAEAFAAEGVDPQFGAVQRSDRPDLAPFQCNGALAAAKQAKANPRAIGEAVKRRLDDNPIFEKVELAGPGFLNLTPADGALAEAAASLSTDPHLGAWQRPVDERQTIILDYGGPNVAKPLHVGHLRAAIIGESLKRLFRAVGDDVLGDIHLGDWGLQMGQLITQLAEEQPDLPYFDADFTGPYPTQSPVTVDDLAALYPRASAASKADPDRRAAAQAATMDLQQGRPGYRALWAHFVDVSKAALEADYAELGVTFDLWRGEASVQDRIGPLTERLKAKGVVTESEGALVIDVAREADKKTLNPVMMIKSNGSVGYHSTDVATIEERVEEFGAERIVYVVDQRQAQHFEEVFRAVERAGLIEADRLEHAGFGTMNGPDGRPFKTREGGVLRLRDLIDQVVEAARRRLAEGGFSADEDSAVREDTARKVGIAALKFGDLSNPRTSDYVFDVDRFVTFEGKTGPYLLYGVVRVRSVIAKAGERPDPAAPILLTDEAERQLVLEMSLYGDAVEAAYRRRLPHLICDHAYRLAQAFSRFYTHCRIGDEADPAVRASRLALALLTARQLEAALTLLGIDVPEKM